MQSSHKHSSDSDSPSERDFQADQSNQRPPPTANDRHGSSTNSLIDKRLLRMQNLHNNLDLNRDPSFKLSSIESSSLDCDVSRPQHFDETNSVNEQQHQY